MSVADCRRNPGCPRDVSEAHIHSDLQRANNQAGGLEAKAGWHRHEPTASPRHLRHILLQLFPFGAMENHFTTARPAEKPLFKTEIPRPVTARPSAGHAA